MGKFKDLSGQQFGSWSVICLHSKQTNRTTKWHCKCLLCGTEHDVSAYSLISGKSTKCRACATKESHIKEFSNDSIKTVFMGMKQRCYNPNTRSYKDYGAKGITICDEWLNEPILFYRWAYDNGYSKGMSIERKDISEGYTPSNCTFIPKGEQAKNRSISHMITMDGETKCLADWCRQYHINASTVMARIKRGLSWENAIKVK